eukprot:14786097-Ditylum_brightwellii.AAC.1
MIEVSGQKSTINHGLHGGRKGHDAKTLLLVEELNYDASYSSQKSLVNFDNDATSYYSRILPNAFCLIERKKGLDKNITFVHAKILQEATYRLKQH